MVRADLVDEIEILVGAESVRVDDPAPACIDPGITGFADAVTPVIIVRIATAGPADVRHLQRFQRGHNVIADAARVGMGESLPTQIPL